MRTRADYDHKMSYVNKNAGDLSGFENDKLEQIHRSKSNRVSDANPSQRSASQESQDDGALLRVDPEALI